MALNSKSLLKLLLSLAVSLIILLLLSLWYRTALIGNELATQDPNEQFYSQSLYQQRLLTIQNNLKNNIDGLQIQSGAIIVPGGFDSHLPSPLLRLQRFFGFDFVRRVKIKRFRVAYTWRNFSSSTCKRQSHDLSFDVFC